jgi:hypothetical protein
MVLARDKDRPSTTTLISTCYSETFSMQWTTVAFRKALVDSLESYRTSSRHDRAILVLNVVKKIEDLASKTGEAIPADLHAVSKM